MFNFEKKKIEINCPGCEAVNNTTLDNVQRKKAIDCVCCQRKIELKFAIDGSSERLKRMKKEKKKSEKKLNAIKKINIKL